MVHTVTKGNETYIYMNGSLLMKRWHDHNRSVHFDKNGWTYDKHTHRSITEQNGVIQDRINN